MRLLNGIAALVAASPGRRAPVWCEDAGRPMTEPIAQDCARKTVLFLGAEIRDGKRALQAISIANEVSPTCLASSRDGSSRCCGCRHTPRLRP